MMECLADSVSDVRVKIPGISDEQDTIVVRSACAAILKEAIDTVRRLRKNSIQRPGDDSNEDDPV